MGKADKTNVMRTLERLRVPYKEHDYSATGAVSGVDVAAALGEDPARAFKTLVTVGKSKNHYVFMIPVAEELDLLISEGIGDEEFMFSKLALTNAYKSIRDSADSISSWYLGTILRKGYVSEPEEDLALMESIKKEDVLEIASSMKLAVVERVTGEAENA